MFDLTFYVLIWMLVGVVGIPTFLITIIFVVLEKIRQARMDANNIEKKLQNIDFIISLIRPERSHEDKQMALDAFLKHFASFEGVVAGSPDLQKRLEFITNFALLDFYEIDKVAKLSENLVAINRGFKKEIEHAIGGALKTRQKKK